MTFYRARQRVDAKPVDVYLFNLIRGLEDVPFFDKLPMSDRAIVLSGIGLLRERLDSFVCVEDARLDSIQSELGKEMGLACIDWYDNARGKLVESLGWKAFKLIFDSRFFVESACLTGIDLVADRLKKSNIHCDICSNARNCFYEKDKRAGKGIGLVKITRKI